MQIVLKLSAEEGKQLQQMAIRLNTTRHDLVTRWAKEHLVVDEANLKAHGPTAEPAKG